MNMHQVLWFIDQLRRFHGRAFTRQCLRANFLSNPQVFGTAEREVARDWDQLESVVSRFREKDCITALYYQGRLKITPKGEEVIQFLSAHCPNHRFPESDWSRRTSEPCILEAFRTPPQLRIRCACYD